jgi:hypothetical protein
MIFTSFLTAACGLVALTNGAPIGTRSTAASPRSLVERASYAVFAGDGSPKTGWPSTSDWVPFEEMWALNADLIGSSCAQFGVQENTPDEIKDIYNAIVKASEGGVPKEFILAIMMQESKGCVRAPTTNWGVRNPGLMQDHDGKHTCNEGGVQYPCPTDQIYGMIDDGANGTPQGDGLKQVLAAAGNEEPTRYYKAARIYNSGRVEGDNLGNGVATHCYSSDIANRLIGWTDGGSSCREAEIGNIAMSESFQRNKQLNPPTNNAPSAPPSTQPPVVNPPSPPASSTPSPSPATPTKEAPKPYTPVQTEAPVNPPAPITTPITKPGDAKGPNDDDNTPAPIAPPAPAAPVGEHYPFAPSECKKWYTVTKDDYCQKVEQALNVPEGTLVQLNSGLRDDCLNLWLDYAYCVAV